MLRKALKSVALRVPPIKRLWDENSRLKQLLNTPPTKPLDTPPPKDKSYSKDLFPFWEPSGVGSKFATTNFLVTSWGHSGSIWLAGSLNLNERVFCSVGVGHPLPSFMIFELNKDYRGWLDLPHEYLYKYGVTTLEKDILLRHKGGHVFFPGDWVTAKEEEILQRPGSAFWKDRNIVDLPRFVFDELEAILALSGENFSLLGNIHGATLDQLHRAFEVDPQTFAKRRVVVMDLIRHPVPRTESAIKATMKLYMQKLDCAITDFIAKNARECLDLERKYGIDFSEPRARASLHVFRQGIQNDVWAYELVHFPQVQRILMERLQNEPEYFSHVFYILSQGREVAEREFLDRVFSDENLVLGRQTAGEMKTRARLPAEQYALWSPWEQEEFSRVAERLNMPKIYFEFGYDFSFLSRVPFSGGSWFPDLQRS